MPAAACDLEREGSELFYCRKHGMSHLNLFLLLESGAREQRTLTVGGSITVRLVSSLTRLELTNEGNIILFVFSEAV